MEVNPVWLMVEDKLRTITGENTHLDLEKILFGENNLIGEHNLTYDTYIVNLFIYETKWQIWKNRNSVKYGNKQSMAAIAIFEQIVESCKRILKFFINTHGKIELKNHLRPFLHRF